MCLPNSLPMAKWRLARFDAKMQLGESMKIFLVQKIIRKQKQNGYIRKFKSSEIHNNGESWYIPIFAVENKNKRKHCIVWDAENR